MKKFIYLASFVAALTLSMAVVSTAQAQSTADCGAAAKNYAAADTAFSGSFCDEGTATPLSPSFPAVGSSTTWTCSTSSPTSSENCTANHASTGGSNDTTNTLDPWGGNSGGNVTRDSIKNATGLGDRDPRAIISSVINVVLGFLGIIAVLLIVVGGFRWMTASGNDEAIAGAKNLMIAGVVGLIIILAAFGIARFVVEALVDATGA